MANDIITLDEHGDVVEDPTRDAVGRPLPRNPAFLGFPPMLPFELAMREDTVPNICKSYGIDREEFEALTDSPVFQKAFEDAKEGLRKEGMSFRIKARMQAEELLKQSWKMIYDESTPNAIRADLIKSTVRWAGYEPKGGGENGGVNAGFQIIVNLGDKT